MHLAAGWVVPFGEFGFYLLARMGNPNRVAGFFSQLTPSCVGVLSNARLYQRGHEGSKVWLGGRRRSA